MSFVSFMEGMAASAGLKMKELSENMIVIPFDTDEGDINVFVRPCGQSAGKTVLEFSDEGFEVPSDLDGKLTLLEFCMERNANMLHGHWALEKSADGAKLCVMATQIAETMDPAEFKASVSAVFSEVKRTREAIRKANQASKVDF